MNGYLNLIKFIDSIKLLKYDNDEDDNLGLNCYVIKYIKKLFPEGRVPILFYNNDNRFYILISFIEELIDMVMIKESSSEAYIVMLDEEFRANNKEAEDLKLINEMFFNEYRQANFYSEFFLKEGPIIKFEKAAVVIQNKELCDKIRKIFPLERVIKLIKRMDPTLIEEN